MYIDRIGNVSNLTAWGLALGACPTVVENSFLIVLSFVGLYVATCRLIKNISIKKKKKLEIKSNAFNKSILIMTTQNYAVFLLSNLYNPRKK